MALAPVVTPLGTRLGRMFDLSPRSVGWIAWAGGAGAVLAGATLLLATTTVGLPASPEGDGVGAAVTGPTQVVFAMLMIVAGFLVPRLKATAAFVMVFSATGVGVLASIEYRPLLAFGLVLMLLVPAVLTWLAWQPHETVGSIAMLAVVTFTSLTGAALGSRQVHDHYFGPTHPNSTTEALSSEADWLWLGGVTPREAVIVAGGLDQETSVTIQYWLAENSEPTSTLSESTVSDHDGVARFELDGLEPETAYAYAVGVAPAVLADATFRTHPVGAANLTIGVASCARNESNGSVFDAIRAQRPDLYLAVGDLHYANLDSDLSSDHLRQYGRSLSQPAQSALFRSVPTAYVWDDHDYGSNDGDSNSPSRLAVSTAYRQAVPHHGVDGDQQASIAQAFSVGRVRFILTDTRSQRTAETMLGEEQLAWLLDELLVASETHALVVWGNPTPWISSAGPGADDWSAFPQERQAIADTIADAGITNLVMVSGDAHMVAIDDGANSGYAADGSPGFPVLHAAALDRRGSEKGGPYSHGTFAGGGQYGLLEIEDDGGKLVTVTLSGHDWQGQELVSHELQIEVPR